MSRADTAVKLDAPVKGRQSRTIECSKDVRFAVCHERGRQVAGIRAKHLVRGGCGAFTNIRHLAVNRPFVRHLHAAP